ncbi:MAG: PIG-L deacetylase family protein [Phycisphaerae bacterium]
MPKTTPSSRKLTLVVVAAHPDDICCCGGLAARYAAEGHAVWQLSVTLGETVRPPGPAQERIKLMRKAEGEEICRILGARAEFLDVPCNKIIPTMEMKMKLVNAIRRLKANIVLFPTPWDCHADHRNLSWTMRDVVYYVGHAGIAADYPPCDLRGAYMYDIEAAHNELHEPDFAVDVTDHVRTNFKAVTCKARAAVFSAAGGRQFKEQYEAVTRFWGMRYGARYAEPIWQTYGSMDMTGIARGIRLRQDLPVKPMRNLE